jgi:hypothetical protein
MKKIVLSLIMVFTFVLSVYSQQTAGKEVNPNAPVISFNEKVHDYGTIYKGGDGTTKFVYSNKGKEPLILSRVKSSCGCTIPKWSRQPLLPGQSDTINVKYDTKRLGSFNKSITITSNASEPTVVLRIKGKVVAETSAAVPTKNVDNTLSPSNK